jgi:hypothetical protein
VVTCRHDLTGLGRVLPASASPQNRNVHQGTARRQKM